MRTLKAAEFKAKCLKVLDEVAQSGEPVTILKRGRPVARLHPAVSTERYAQDTLAGSVEVLGDIVSPPLPAEAWVAEGKKSK